MSQCAIRSDRYTTGQPYALDIVRRDLSGLGLPSRREAWDVYALDEQEAHRTVDYHFGSSALWYRLTTVANRPGGSQ